MFLWDFCKFCSYKEGPLSLILYMEVIVDRDPVILPRVILGQGLNEQLVKIGCRMIAREKVETDLNLYNWIFPTWFNQTQIYKTIKIQTQ